MVEELLHSFCCFECNSLFAIGCVKGCSKHVSSAVAAARYCSLTPCRFHPFSKHPTDALSSTRNELLHELLQRQRAIAVSPLADFTPSPNTRPTWSYLFLVHFCAFGSANRTVATPDKENGIHTRVVTIATNHYALHMHYAYPKNLLRLAFFREKSLENKVFKNNLRG